VFDLRLGHWTNDRNEQSKQGQFFRVHRFSFP
jgi:hypothetical protein